MKSAPALLVAAAALAAHGLVVADSGRSLNQVRSEMNSGTWKGITLIEAKPKAPASGASAGAAAATVTPAAPAVTSAVTPAPAVPSATTATATTATATAEGTAAPVPTAPAATTPSIGQRLGELFGPPSGVPMNEAKRLDSPSGGIVLPTSSSAASAPSATPPKAP